MTEHAQSTHTDANPIQPPQFHSPPPPHGDPPTTSLTGAQPSAQTQAEPPAGSLPQSIVPPTAPEPQISAAAPTVDPFSDAAAPAQPGGLRPEEPPQHPDRPLPVGAVTETPLHSEPAPILPPRPQVQAQPEPQYQVLPPPRASFDQPIPDHPAMQASLGQAQPVAPPPQAPILDSNAQALESDPAISSLHAMFPDFDLLVIQSVLEATGGDKDQAIDSLLAMSDPEYAQAQSQTTTAGVGTGPGHQGRPPTQTELDEEFARRLMLEEEQQAGAWQPTGNQYTQSVPYQQYQPRRSGEYQRPPAGAGGGGFGEMAGDLQQQFRSFIGGAAARRGPQAAAPTQGGAGTGAGTGAGYQEQFNRIADTGKKTLNTIFSKVKQKMEEFDNRNPPDTQHMNQPQQSGHWSNWQASGPAQQQQVPTYAQSPAGQYAPPAQSPPPAQHGALNSNPYSIPATASSTNPNPNPNTDTSSALPRSSGGWQYQPDQPETLPAPPAQSPPSTTAAVPAPAPAATSTTEEPRRSIDAARLGLLPKRPVSLMDVNTNTRAAQPQPQAQAQDSDDDLEYVDRPMPGAMTRM